MMKLFWTYLVIHCIASAEDQADSTRLFPMSDVVVTGIRFNPESRLLPSSVRVLSLGELQQSTGSSVASAIKDIPSIFVRGYGGNGSLQTISMRGMGAEYTNVLVDGEEFSSQQNALTDLGIFLTDDVEQIEIAKGGYSSFVGSNAISGVVNIVTKKPTKEFHTSLGGMVGSFGSQSHSLSVSGGGDAVRLKSTYSIERSRNNYDFSFNDGTKEYSLQRSGSDYRIRNIGVSALSDITDSIQTAFCIRHSMAERGSPSAVTNPYQNNLTRLKDDNLFIVSSTKWNYSPQTVFSAIARFQLFQQNYHDPNGLFSLNGENTYSVQRIEAVSISGRYVLNEYNLLNSGIEGSIADVQGSDLTPKTRFHGAAYFSSEHHVVEPIDLFLYPSFRFDSYENSEVSFSPNVGVNTCIVRNPEIRLRGSLSRNFRIPTFNELYWNPGGNPNLQSEKSVSGDIGLLVNYDRWGKWNIEATYFVIDTKDRIIWIPGEAGVWSPQNVYRVGSSGLELFIRHSLLKNRIEWKASYSYMEVLRKEAGGSASQLNNKQLPYIPFELASLSLQWNIDPLSISFHHSLTGFRYINENNDPKFILPEFQTTDLVCFANITLVDLSFTVKAEAKNLLNSEFQWIPSYPVPGRNYALSCSLHI